jgi:hypothetical protein
MAYYKKTPKNEESKKYLTIQDMKRQGSMQGGKNSLEMLDTSLIGA